MAIGAIVETHHIDMARVQCEVGIKCLSCTEKREGPTLVAQKCGHKFHISLRSKVRRHRDTKRQSGLPNLLLALLVSMTSAYSNLGVLQRFKPPTSATNSISLPLSHISCLLRLMCCAGGAAISSPCPVWEWSFSSVLFLELWCLFQLPPVVIMETLFCVRKQFSAAVLAQDEYWSLTIMQQPSPWDALLEIRLTTQYSKRNRFNQTEWQNQAQYFFKILTNNIVVGVQSNSQEMAPSAIASY